jgi:heme/copper-type cytochrome/quinol oxidase subunit 3
MVLAYAAAVEKNRKKTMLFLGLTVLGGLGFLGGQVKEYTGLIHEGLIFAHSAYATTFYIITSFHGLHVLTGTIYNSVTLWRTSKGTFDNGNVDGIEIAGLFWHFVDLVWILVFTFVYLIPEPVKHG